MIPLHIQLTQYGYPDDPYADSLTERGIPSIGVKHAGAWDNELTATSCALKRSTASRIGAIPQCKVRLTWSNQALYRFWDDVVPETDPGDRCDLYQPGGYDDHLPDYVMIEVVADEGNSPASPLA